MNDSKGATRGGWRFWLLAILLLPLWWTWLLSLFLAHRIVYLLRRMIGRVATLGEKLPEGYARGSVGICLGLVCLGVVFFAGIRSGAKIVSYAGSDSGKAIYNPGYVPSRYAEPEIESSSSNLSVLGTTICFGGMFLAIALALGFMEGKQTAARLAKIPNIHRDQISEWMKGNQQNKTTPQDEHSTWGTWSLFVFLIARLVVSAPLSAIADAMFRQRSWLVNIAVGLLQMLVAFGFAYAFYRSGLWITEAKAKNTTVKGGAAFRRLWLRRKQARRNNG